MIRVFLLTLEGSEVTAREIVGADWPEVLRTADGPALAVLVGGGCRGVAMNAAARGAPLQALRAWVRDRGGVW